MSTERETKGRCFCGAVEVTAVGKPVAQGYCHCTSCREWSASPVNAFTLWPPEKVSITRGVDLVESYSKTERSVRKWCKRCGGHVLNQHPGWKVIDVYAAVIPDFPFDPQLHVNYAETVLRMRDGLPKLKDYPKEMGGSGATVPE
ncbi:MAG TPA: GFA family protein [Myxococcaceae bacterium]|nr:GFA family protein [Myxococcaceae bacterium]